MPKSEISVDLITRLKDKGFKDLGKETKKSDKALGALAKKLTAVFSVAALGSFAKASIKAFADEDREIKKLGAALGVLGKQYQLSSAEEFISSLQKQFAVSDGELRPALQTLITSTGDLSKAEKILQVALDASAGTGKDLTSVSVALGKAFNGNTTSLKKFVPFLTNAELKTKSFDEILNLISNRFTGQAKAAAESYAGQLKAVSIATDELQETIGKALVTATQLASGKNGVGGLTSALEAFGKEAEIAIIGTGGLIDKFNKLSTDNRIVNFFTNLTKDVLDSQGPIVLYNELIKSTGKTIIAQQNRIANNQASNRKFLNDYKKQQEIARQYEAEQAARKKEMDAAAKKAAVAAKAAAEEKARREKRQALENKSKFRFDQDLINLSAALKRDIDAKDRARAIEIFNLKKSGYEDDINAIKTLENTQKGYYDLLLNNEKIISEARTATKVKTMADIAEIKDAAATLNKPGYFLKIDSNANEVNADLIKIKAALAQYEAKVATALAPIYTDPIFTKNLVEGLSISEKRLIDEYIRTGRTDQLINPYTGNDLMAIIDQIKQAESIYNAARGAYKAIIPPSELTGIDTTGVMSGGAGGGTVVNVTVTGSVISQNDLVSVITDAVYQTQRNGNTLQIAQ